MLKKGSRSKTKKEEKMDEQTKRRMIRNYFEPLWTIWIIRNYFKLFPKWMIVIGVVFLPIVLIVGIGFDIYSYARGKPTDQQMDEWLEEDLKGLEKKALNKMGIDETELVSESVQIIGPRLWDVGGADVFFKRGKDNVLRFTPVDVSIINFTQSQLLVYSCVLDLTTGNVLNESTDEYFYKDVVQVSTKTESRTVNIPKLGTLQLNAAETFTLTTSGGTSLSVVLRDPTLIEKMGGGEIPTTRAEKAIQTVRKMLREKKT
jgi:hypothetical protein